MIINSEQVKLLRVKTGAGMMDCKKALEDSVGDMEKAIDYLRKKGAATAQKRADKAVKEGVIVTRVSGDNKLGVLVEVNCETDFVARGNDFVEFANTVAQVLEQKNPSTFEELLESVTTDGKTITTHLNDLVGKIGEKIEIRRFKTLQSNDGFISAYTHLGSKIGVLVEFGGDAVINAQTGRDIAMQIAAMNPQFIGRDQVTIDIIQRELEIYRTQAKNEGKPEQVIERIANGKLEKFYQEVCLLEQTFIKDSGKTIKDIINEAGGNLTLKQFERFHLGEEKK
ncbi:MAG: translation elongation factor Ts [Bacteroidetes bacterium]|nr:translation elongation factor Ts [Bacteroidota bacterium]MBU1422970.1 translation elongation factor Ts [Bacteroidota bacterium]MBU2636170.1 translation elongation factor Ts [Bacteroidota bacterium]